MRPFVFIHIPGGSFIFNISMGQRPFSDLDQREPPQWAQIGVLHPLHKHRAFVVRSSVDLFYRSAAFGTGQRALALGISVHAIITVVNNK